MIHASNFPLLDRISSGILAIDRDGRIMLWNSVMESWHRKSRAEMSGKNLFKLFPHLDNSMFKAELAGVFDSSNTAVFPAADQQIIPCPLAGGEFRHQKVTISLLDEHQLALFTIEDQTEQRKLIHDYRKIAASLQSELNQKSRLISAIDQAAEAIIIATVDGKIDYVNKAFFTQTGWQHSDLSNATLAQLFTQAEDGFETHLNRVFSEGKTWQGRQKISGSDGTLFTASVSIAPIQDESGTATHVVIIQEDISQQVALDERLRRSQKQEALVTLVGGIAHDFNNLLAGLIGQTYLASREVKEMPKTLTRLKKVQKIAQEASEIVKQLLTFARQGDHSAKEFPLSAFIKEFHKLAQHTVPESIQLRLDFSPDEYTFRGDANQLQQSLLNMIQNAVEACGDNHNGLIELTLNPLDPAKDMAHIVKYPVLRHGNFAHIQIRDNGRGISSENIEKIFDPFYTTKQLGSGLGLAIVMGCIRSHHAIIDVQSTPGEGSTFHLFLPLKVAKPMTPTIPVENSLNATILLVDDDPNVLEPTKELLECMGHHVTLACDGIEACERFESNPAQWDIVITDMVMPRMNGLEAARRMRMLVPTIPIIFATGYDRSLVIEDTRKMAQTLLISKPFNPDELDQQIIKMVKTNRGS
ncbi:PAS domain-containing sensor histidine kinase [Mariprofundus sp. KV]|uniref:PAS domain-containing hybrid sensor histidine kinase/response regulator n=1 Tax=Mariprofundus sp. KV TaxID=2608715 RepID=UPI0015A13DB5|nr:PAS domain-containing sensor histidine kinase [Mariprofundus sp. KV]NWF36110.1 PAS domain-containing protein [Mariprofundus sp. KV]